MRWRSMGSREIKDGTIVVCACKRRTTLKLKILFGAIICSILVLAIPAFAHHSFAMFDNSKWLILKGTVVEYRWENPHTHIIVNVLPSGAPNPSMAGTWDVEAASINIMARQGWNKISFKAGDTITAVAHPLKSGDKGCSLSYVVLPSGVRRYQDVARPDGPPEDASKKPD